MRKIGHTFWQLRYMNQISYYFRYINNMININGATGILKLQIFLKA